MDLDGICGLAGSGEGGEGSDSGEIKVGAAADLVMFDLNEPWQIKVDNLRSKSRNAPYDGRPVQGRVLKTWINGKIAFDIDVEN